MTLKSFYSRNHRLPSPWIRAVTPAPACLPPWLPKLPAGRQQGRLPSYCQKGQGRGRTGWGVGGVEATRTHTLSASTREGEMQNDRLADRDTERERNTDISHQDRHRPLPAQLRYAHSQIHTHFPKSDAPHSGSHTPRFTSIYKTQRYTQIMNTHSPKFQAHTTQKIYIPRFIGTNPTFGYILSDSQTHMYIRNADTYNS